MKKRKFISALLAALMTITTMSMIPVAPAEQGFLYMTLPSSKTRNQEHIMSTVRTSRRQSPAICKTGTDLQTAIPHPIMWNLAICLPI